VKEYLLKQIIYDIYGKVSMTREDLLFPAPYPISTFPALPGESDLIGIAVSRTSFPMAAIIGRHIFDDNPPLRCFKVGSLKQPRQKMSFVETKSNTTEIKLSEIAVSFPPI